MPILQLPKKTALYRHFDKDGVLLYVGISVCPVSRFKQHIGQSEWVYQVARIDVEWITSRREALAAEDKAIDIERPIWNTRNATNPSLQVKARVRQRRAESFAKKCENALIIYKFISAHANNNGQLKMSQSNIAYKVSGYLGIGLHSTIGPLIKFLEDNYYIRKTKDIGGPRKGNTYHIVLKSGNNASLERPR